MIYTSTHNGSLKLFWKMASFIFFKIKINHSFQKLRFMLKNTLPELQNKFCLNFLMWLTCTPWECWQKWVWKMASFVFFRIKINHSFQRIRFMLKNPSLNFKTRLVWIFAAINIDNFRILTKISLKNGILRLLQDQNQSQLQKNKIDF